MAPPPELPPELTYEVLRHLIPLSSHVKHELKKAHWPCIRNLSLSSRLLRRAALDCWFASLFVRHSSDWQRVESFSSVEIIKTASRLHIFAAALDPQSICRLARYEKLKALSVNMHVLWSESPDSLRMARELVPHLPPSLTSLEISCMSPDQCRPELLGNLSSVCPSLERLGFYSAASDCVACAEEITLPFPIPQWFASAEELAVSPKFKPEDDINDPKSSFAESLSNLKRLKSISLPIHLSHSDIYEMHLTGGHPLRRTLDRESNCPLCVQDYGPSTSRNEETVARYLAEKIDSLSDIDFATWVYGNGKGAVRFQRSSPGLKRNLVSSYSDTQDWDGGRI